MKDLARAFATLHLNFGSAALFKWSVGINELQSSDHAVSLHLFWTKGIISSTSTFDKVRLGQPQGLTLPQVANYRHVDIELREALTITYMKRVQELLTGRVVEKEDEATLLKVFLPNFFNLFYPFFYPFLPSFFTLCFAQGGQARGKHQSGNARTCRGEGGEGGEAGELHLAAEQPALHGLGGVHGGDHR